MKQSTKDVIVIGGGQSALAVGYYLRKTNLDYLILDQQEQAGGNWPHYWESLRLFSPAQWSSLPGVLMPGGADYYPGRVRKLDRLCLGHPDRGRAICQTDRFRSRRILILNDDPVKHSLLAAAMPGSARPCASKDSLPICYCPASPNAY